MTTPDLKQNTVFIVAPDVKAEPENCDVGKDIRQRRAEAVRVATIDSWWLAEGQGWLEYTLHYMKCAQCQEVELARRAGRWDAIEEELK
jgi:hypothetical protein